MYHIKVIITFIVYYSVFLCIFSCVFELFVFGGQSIAEACKVGSC